MANVNTLRRHPVDDQLRKGIAPLAAIWCAQYPIPGQSVRVETVRTAPELGLVDGLVPDHLLAR